MTTITPDRGYSTAIAAYATGFEHGQTKEHTAKKAPDFCKTQQEIPEYCRGHYDGWFGEPRAPKTEDQLRAEEEKELEQQRTSHMRI